MPEISLDPIVLGHNPFFGVDHLSRERGSQREAQFGDPGTILDMIRFSADHGVQAMMMSTHPRSTLVAEQIRKDPDLVRTVALYPLLPYITKYVRQSNEKGLVNLVLDQLKSAGWGQRLQVLGSGSLGLLKRDYPEMLKTLIRIELMPFQGLRMKGVFLHDALTDLALALDIPEVFELYCSEISQRFGAEPGFATKNLPFLVDRFRAYGLKRPLVLAHWNKVGFGMNPSREACEKCLAENELRLMAMGTLASGYLKPGEAYEYLFGLPGIDSVVVGVSSRAHARETFEAIERHRKSKVA
jgi:hypothetical protein